MEDLCAYRIVDCPYGCKIGNLLATHLMVGMELYNHYLILIFTNLSQDQQSTLLQTIL